MANTEDTEHQSSYVNVDTHKVGLDRGHVLPHETIELPRDNEPLPGDASKPAVQENEHVDPSKREKLREKKDHAKEKLKKVLHLHHETAADQYHDYEAPVLAEPPDEKSDSRLVYDPPAQDEKKTFKDFVHHPVSTVKESVQGEGSHEAAANIAAKETPHGKDVDLVRAHDRVENAQTETEKLLAIRDFDQLVRERQNLFIRWTVDRHITKLRRLPRDEFPRKRMRDFERWDPVEGKVVDWRGYLSNVSD